MLFNLQKRKKIEKGEGKSLSTNASILIHISSKIFKFILLLSVNLLSSLEKRYHSETHVRELHILYLFLYDYYFLSVILTSFKYLETIYVLLLLFFLCLFDRALIFLKKTIDPRRKFNAWLSPNILCNIFSSIFFHLLVHELYLIIIYFVCMVFVWEYF